MARATPHGLDWTCVNPEARVPLVPRAGHELKLVYPQEGTGPARYADLCAGRSTHPCE